MTLVDLTGKRHGLRARRRHLVHDRRSTDPRVGHPAAAQRILGQRRRPSTVTAIRKSSSSPSGTGRATRRSSRSITQANRWRVGRRRWAASRSPRPRWETYSGDEKLEVLVPDHRGHIPGVDARRQAVRLKTVAEAQGHSYEGDVLPDTRADAEKCTSIFKDHIACQGPVSLADLDGDGLAEVIAIDQQSRLRAWHGDGSGFGDPDGVIAQLPGGDRFGVSVTGPDQAGAFDFFAGASWVHRTRRWPREHPRDGDARPQARRRSRRASRRSARTRSRTWTATATPDILIGTEDGRVIVFPTGLAYSASWAQWPTQAANPQHTALWKSPKR